MSDPLTAVALATGVVVVMAFLLSRLIPDNYDQLNPGRVDARRDGGL